MNLANLFNTNPSLEAKSPRELLKLGQNLSKTLPYEEFLEDRNLIILKDESIGVLYEVDLIEHETKKNEEIQSKLDSLKNWLSLPSDFSLQYLFTQEKMSEEEIRSECSDEKFSGHHELADYLHDEKVNTLVKNSNDQFPLFNRKGFLLVRENSKKDVLTLRDRLPKSSGKVFLEENKAFAKRLMSFEREMSQFEALSPLSLERQDANQFSALVRKMIYGDSIKCKPFPNYCTAYPLADQIMDESIDVDFSGKKGKFGVSRAVSLKVPAIKYPAMTAWYLTLPFPVTVSVQLNKPPKSKIDLYLNWKEFSLKNSLSESSKREFEEVKEIKKKLAFDEEAIWVSTTILVEAENEQILEDYINEIKKVCIEKFDCFCTVEEDMGLAIWWDSLPFNYKLQSDLTYQRAYPLLSNDITYFVPIYDSCGKIGSRSLQVLQSREGNLTSLNLFEQISSHTMYLGDTGSGKSRILGEVIYSAKRPESEYLVFIFEVKTSYPMLVNFFGGELNKYSVSEKPKSSPFKGVYDEEKIVFLTNWIKAAIEITSPSFKIESELKEAIYQSIKKAATKKKKAAGISFVDGELVESDMEIGVVINIDDICTEISNLPSEKQFEELTDDLEELLSKLSIFRGDGIYASYFRPDGAWEPVSGGIFDSDFEGTKSDPVIRDLTFLQEFEKIRQIRMQPENQGKEVIIILDEIAELDRGIPMFADIISGWAETSRKEGVWFHFATCTPSVFNDKKLKACGTCLRVAHNYVFTSMSDENLSALDLDFEVIDERDKEIIRSLKTVKGQYSEFYVITKDGERSVYRLVESPVKRWLQPTNAKDTREALRALKLHNNDAAKAAKDLQTRFPNGVE